jgi:hypothetical protein
MKCNDPNCHGGGGVLQNVKTSTQIPSVLGVTVSEEIMQHFRKFYFSKCLASFLFFPTLSYGKKKN